MKRWTPLVSMLLFLATSSVNSAEEKFHYGRKNSFDGPELHRLLTLLEPSNLLRNYVYVEKFARVDAKENNTCYEDIQRIKEALFNNLTQKIMWPYKMLDASSKLPSGLLEGNLVDLGMYDECIAIRGDPEIRGQHCMYSLDILELSVFVPTQIQLAICFPSSCSADDIIEVLNTVIPPLLEPYNITIPEISITCSPIDQEIWDTEFIICFTILVIFVAFLVICTVLEIISERNEAFQKSNISVTVLSQFSLKKSALAIFNMQLNKGNLPVLHGIRFISMAWIVLGHEFMYMTQFPLINKLRVNDSWILEWNSLYIFTAQYAVDTFFVISGFLLAYVFLKQKKFNLPFYYLHRIIRLTPPIIALFVFFVVFMPKVGSGPQWYEIINNKTETCRENWWPTFLYVQNFVYIDKCLGHLWYLAVDMQLFWISPLILYPLQKKPTIGLIILSAFFLASVVTPAVLIAVNEYPIASYLKLTDMTKIKDMFNDIYVAPHTRAAPWLMGIYLGYEIVMKTRKLTKTIVYIGWFLALGGFAFCTFFTRYFLADDYVYDLPLEAIFTAISRPIWGFGVCWIIFASVNNCGGIIVKFLSSRIFLPFSRISYCIYLVHMVIELMQHAALRTVKYFSDYYVWYYCLSDFAICIFVGTSFSLLFESPILVLDKMMFGKPKKPKSDPPKELPIPSIKKGKECCEK